MANEIISELKGSTLHVTFNRPERNNAFMLDMANQLFTLLKNTTTNPAVRLVVLRGKSGHFMDGLDKNIYFHDSTAGAERANQIFQPYNSSIKELQTMEKPVLAVVEGHVNGPGFSFMLASDFVIAARSAKFSGGFISHAIPPDGGTTFSLPRKIGPLRAAQFLMLDETINPDEAQRIGLVNSVVEDGMLDTEVAQWVDRLVKMPTKAVGAAKTLLNRSFEQALHQQLALEHAYWGHCSRSFDFKEGIRANVGKREPKYTGA